MKKLKKIAAVFMMMLLTVCMCVACGEVKSTETPAEPTPSPSAETLTPTHTPEPYGGPLYTWEYIEYEPGKLEIVVSIPEEVDRQDITELIVPKEIDGKLVTKLPWDFLGSRSGWGGRKGFMNTTKRDAEGNPTEWNNDADIWLEKIVFPDSIEYIDYGLLWSGISTLEEIVFEGGDNIEYVGTAPFRGAPAEEYMAEDNGGFWIVGKYLLYMIPEENIVIPENVKRIAPQLMYPCSGGVYRMSDVKTIKINDGCEEIGYSFLYQNVDLDWIYIPASVTSIGEKLSTDDESETLLKASVTIRCQANSYAETWATEHGFKIEIVND